jgi:hypothetical protein
MLVYRYSIMPLLLAKFDTSLVSHLAPSTLARSGERGKVKGEREKGKL